MTRKAVFLDRDGTIIPETGARTADPRVEPLPVAAPAIQKLREAGFLIVVVTNQSGIARGYYTEDDLRVMHEALLAKLAAAGAPVDALYYCPHLPEGTVARYAVACDCRKPKPGLFLRAAKEHDIDLPASYVVGDSERDIQAAQSAGCKGTALIQPDQIEPFTLDFGRSQWQKLMDEIKKGFDTEADAIVPDVEAAAQWVLEMETGKAARPLKLAVLLSGGGTTLENIFAKIDDGKLDAQVAVVIASRPDAYGLVRAKNHGVEAVVVERKKFPDEPSFSDALNAKLDEYDVDLVCLAGFMVMWKMSDRYLGRVMNIHPALIPAFCGRGYYGHRVHEAVLEYGAKVSGCTVHFADRVYDRGPVIVQKAVPVLDDDTPETLAARVFEQECEAYPEAIQLFAEGRLRIEGRRVRVMGRPE